MSALQLKAQAKAADQPIPDEETVREQIVERLIVESLQLQTGDRAGVRISDDELNEALSSVAAQNRMNLTQFRAAVESDGISWVEMRETVRRDLTINHVQQGIMRSRIKITPGSAELSLELGRLVTADEYRRAFCLPSRTSRTAPRSRGSARRTRCCSACSLVKTSTSLRSRTHQALEGDLGWRRTAALPTMFSGLRAAWRWATAGGHQERRQLHHPARGQTRRGSTGPGRPDRGQHVLIKLQRSAVRTRPVTWR